MSESYPYRPESTPPSDLFRLAHNVPADLERLIGELHPVHLYSLQCVAKRSCLNMSQTNKLMADRLAALIRGIKTAAGRQGVDPNPYGDAAFFGGGLIYAALELHFDGQVPELDPAAAGLHHIDAWPVTSADRGWFTQLGHHITYEAHRDQELSTITDRYRPYLPRPDTVNVYRAGAGYVKYMAAIAEAHQRVQRGLTELASLEKQHGNDLSGLFDKDLEELLGEN